MSSNMQFKRSEWWKAAICTLIAFGIMYAFFGPHNMKQTNTEQSEKAVSFGKVYVVPLEVKGMIKRHEGIETKVYPDTEGLLTIGVGFNLHKKGAKERIVALGLDWNSVIKGNTELTVEQIEYLFDDDLKTACADAWVVVPNLNEQPKEVKIVVINMAYNLGLTRFCKFENFRQALWVNDYQKAADEMVNSRWYNQVGNRSKELVEIMRSVPDGENS